MSVRKAIREELDGLVGRLVGFSRASKAIDSQVRQLKKRFQELSERHIDMDGRSRIWPATPLGMRLRVTYPEASPPPVDYDRLMHVIGPVVFAKIFKVKGAEMDLEAWDEAIKNEEVKDSQLTDCIGDLRSPPRPSVMVERIPKE